MQKRSSIVALLLAVGATAVAPVASAECLRGTPQVNRVLMDGLPRGPHSQLGVANVPTLLWYRAVSRWLSTDFAERGGSEPLSTDREYSKIALAATLLSFGVSNVSLPVRQDPDTGAWGYDSNALYLNLAAHRSGDEWALLIADQEMEVCDALDPGTGRFSCPKSEGWWFFSRTRKFGPELRVSVDDVISPYASASFGWGYDTKGYLIGSDLTFFCPMFDYPEGPEGRRVLDEASLPQVVYALAAAHGRGMSEDAEVDEVGRWTWNMPEPGAGIAPIARSALGRYHRDRDISPPQLAYEALCDLTQEPQDWVPNMVVETMNAGANWFRRERRVFNTSADTSDAGMAPFSCGRTDANPLVDSEDRCAIRSCMSGDHAACSDLDTRTIQGRCSDGCCVAISRVF